MSPRHIGHTGAMLSPFSKGCLSVVARYGTITPKKTLDFRYSINFTNPIKDHLEVPWNWTSWATYVADFVENSLELFNSQHKESSVSWMGIEMPWIFWITEWLLRTSLRCWISHWDCCITKSQNFASGWGMFSSFVPTTKLLFFSHCQSKNRFGLLSLSSKWYLS